MKKILRTSIATAIALGSLTSCAQPSGILNPNNNNNNNENETEYIQNTSNFPIGQNSQETANGEMSEQKMKLEDGRTVTCIVFYGYRAGGISCDWDSEHNSTEN